MGNSPNIRRSMGASNVEKSKALQMSTTGRKRAGEDIRKDKHLR
jgi:hypothetical protein